MFIIEKKLAVLAALERVFDEYVRQEYQTACAKNCSVCCTLDVTATSLEAHRLLKALPEANRSELTALLSQAVQGDLYRPRLTTNTLAMACMNRLELPEEKPGTQTGPCPFLSEDLCVAYEARPFSCRGMLALDRCRPGEAAEMPPELVSIVTACWQIIEHLDVNGLWGNLIDLMLLLADEDRANQYSGGQQIVTKGLPPTRPLPGFLVPPEQQEVFQGFLTRLLEADVDGQTFRQRMSQFRESRF